MSVDGINTAASALQASQFLLDVTANNIANVNTDGFQASAVTFSDRAYINDIGQGVQVSGTYQPDRPVPAAADEENPGVLTEKSNTDLVVEMTNMLAARNMYGVNIAVSRTADEASQILIDLKR